MEFLPGALRLHDSFLRGPGLPQATLALANHGDQTSMEYFWDLEVPADDRLSRSLPLTAAEIMVAEIDNSPHRSEIATISRWRSAGELALVPFGRVPERPRWRIESTGTTPTFKSTGTSERTPDCSPTGSRSRMDARRTRAPYRS